MVESPVRGSEGFVNHNEGFYICPYLHWGYINKRRYLQVLQFNYIHYDNTIVQIDHPVRVQFRIASNLYM